MKYIFIPAKGCSNKKELWNEESKRKKDIKCKEMAFWRGSNNFIYL